MPERVWYVKSVEADAYVVCGRCGSEGDIIRVEASKVCPQAVLNDADLRAHHWGIQGKVLLDEVPAPVKE